MFDYEGKFSKRKDKNAKEFQYSNLESGASNHKKDPKKRSISHCLPSTKEDNVVIQAKMLNKKSK